MIKFIGRLLGLDLIAENKKLKVETEKNLAETKRLLTLNGEDKWMLNLCKVENEKKECLPNE